MLSLLSSCQDLGKELNKGLDKTSLKLYIDYPEDFDLNSNDRLVLTVVNRHTNDSLRLYTRDKKTLSLELEAGIYNLDLSNEQSTNTKAYSARKDNLVVSGQNLELNLKLQNAFFSKDWLISEVHFTANETDHGLPYFQDGYIELYNNSDERIYADGLCLSRCYMLTNEDYNIWSEYKDAAVPFYILEIKGNGTDYPVEAGGRLLLAVSAINHHKENPASRYDLSMADFEMYSENSLSGIDNPKVPNMNLFYLESEYASIIFSVSEAYFIFKPKNGQSLANYLSDKNVSERENNGALVHSYAIPNSDIIDAVHIGQRESKINQMLFAPYVDAGFTYCTVGQYNFVAKRKVFDKQGGRLILQDTNNSTEDFLANQESSYLIKTE